MGSTGTRREPGISDREFFEKELLTTLGTHGRITACTSRPTSGGEWNRVFYAAVTNYDTAPHQPGRTWALVILMHSSRNRSEYCNFTYKDLDETVGPAEDTRPDRILDLLSPTDHPYAVDWRARCRTYNAKRTKARTLVHGQVVEFDAPLAFAGGHGQAQRFQYLREGRRILWLALDDQDVPRFRCRISRWRDREFTIVPSRNQEA